MQHTSIAQVSTSASALHVTSLAGPVPVSPSCSLEISIYIHHLSIASGNLPPLLQLVLLIHLGTLDPKPFAFRRIATCWPHDVHYMRLCQNLVAFIW